MTTMPPSSVPSCSPFSCHVDCATGCAADDQPFDHPDYAYHPPSFDDDGLRSRDHSVASSTHGEEKGIESSVHGPVSTWVCFVFVFLSGGQKDATAVA